jgi:1-phosphatidylinositol phosphodiesterase
MSIKEETQPESGAANEPFENILNDNYLQPNINSWYLGETVPTLGQVRGKIVLLRRFGAANLKGIDATAWPDNNALFTITGPATIRGQDHYALGRFLGEAIDHHNANAKWNDIVSFYQGIASTGPEVLNISFTSAIAGGSTVDELPNIPIISGHINPMLNTYFQQNPSGRFGISAIDFIDDFDLPLAIVNTNFPGAPVSKAN